MIKTKKHKVLIIGAGTAGITIAYNLQNFFDVTVIEKSKNKKYPLFFKIPLMIGLLFRNSKTKFLSSRKIALTNGRNIPFFESNLIGGASVINGCVHMLGNRNQWNKILKKFNSNYTDLLESYDKLYSTDLKEENIKINIKPAPLNNIDNAFIKTLELQNIPLGDMIFSDKESCGYIHNTVKGLFRTSVLSLLKNKLFTIFSGEEVEQIVYRNGRVEGVKTSKRLIHADYVVIAGGVIGTCSLLLKAAHIDSMSKIKFHNKEEIGFDIKDHTNLRINIFTKDKFGSLNEISSSFFQKFSLLLRHLFGQSSLLQGTGATSAVHLDLDNDGLIDTRIQIVQFTESGRHGSDGKYFNNKPGFSLSINPIYPESKGRVYLKDSETIVDPNFLSSQKDIELLRLALKFCLKALRSYPLNKLILKIEHEDEIENNTQKYIEENIYSGHHLIGGAAKLVDKDFKVKNANGLYICDASIFDSYAASNIHSSVVLISDIFSKKFISTNL